ncbi:unnamed protein product [Allacma fusca]|uniref:Uncharacterized protein n=1 Tax=Allacma fusca TaxID=39272 RepID=A0A8J2KJE8_9HEXA|nr:unnamed protein product [Allacma fusca]
MDVEATFVLNFQIASRSGAEAFWAEEDLEESPNEDSDDNVSEVEDAVEELCDEDDDNAFLGDLLSSPVPNAAVKYPPI